MEKTCNKGHGLRKLALVKYLETEWNRYPDFCLSGASWPAWSQSAKSVCLGDVSSLEVGLGFELWVRLNDIHHRLWTALWNRCQNKQQHFHRGVFILHVNLGFVNVDSVWSAAHSQSSTLQYPFLVQPESGGTAQPCTTAEPCPPLSGNTHTYTQCCCICEEQWLHVVWTHNWTIAVKPTLTSTLI